MTSPMRFEQDLPALLADLYVGVSPDYRDDLFGQTARTSQRPAWTFLERWIPVDIATRRLPAANIPWRTLAVTLLVLVLAAAALFAVAGSPRRVPPPFGPAGNGSILASSGGNIYVRDSVTGASRLLIGDSGADGEAGASPDGTLVAFVRYSYGQRYLMAANIDGSHVRRVLAEPLIDDWAQWAPDSRHLGVITRVDNRRQFRLVSTEGGPETGADLGVLDPEEFQFRPPDGHEIALRATEDGGNAVYLMNTDGSNRRKLGLQAAGAFDAGMGPRGLSWSPSGEQLGYTVPAGDPGSIAQSLRLRVLTIASGRDDVFSTPADPHVNQAWSMWSPDGSKILVQRFTDAKGWIAILPADGSSAGVQEVDPNIPFADNTQLDDGWSPDGRTILLRYDDSHFYSVDVASGQLTPLSWSIDRIPDWQRVALP